MFHANAKKITAGILCAVTVMASSGITSFAAPKIMWNGMVFDPQFYAETYPDAEAVCGTDEDSLLYHFMSVGQVNGYLPASPADEALVQDLEAQQEAWKNAIKAQIDASQTVSPYTEIHNDYYKNIPKEGQAQAEQICSAIADAILNNHELTTDLERVSYAAQVVSDVCSQDTYASDAKGWYRSPYGVFIAGVYTCSGATRTLGRILDYMGYKWVHHNRNRYAHQWCEVMLDGYPAYADGMSGYAGYGTMYSGMTVPGGGTIIFPE